MFGQSTPRSHSPPLKQGGGGGLGGAEGVALNDRGIPKKEQKEQQQEQQKQQQPQQGVPSKPAAVTRTPSWCVLTFYFRLANSSSFFSSSFLRRFFFFFSFF